MVLTVLYYIISLITSTRANYKTALKSSIIVMVLYMGLRYNYMPDYKNYLAYFERVANGYIYAEGRDHMEYGWYLLNKFLAPISFYGFIFLGAVIMGWGIYVLLKRECNSKYLPYVILGIVTTGGTPVLMSAFRQYIVAALFLNGFNYLLYGRIRKYKDLFRLNILCYFILIYLCSQLHTSASFLYIIPFLFFVPSNKKIAIGIAAFLFISIVGGQTFVPSLVQGFYEQHDRYTDILEHEIEMENMTITSFLSYSIQIVFCAIVFAKHKLNSNSKVVLLVAFLSIFFAISIFFISQLYRLSMYLIPLYFISIKVICENWNSKIISINYIEAFYGIWIFWNALKAFTIRPGSVEEYKTIFSLL